MTLYTLHIKIAQDTPIITVENSVMTLFTFEHSKTALTGSSFTGDIKSKTKTKTMICSLPKNAQILFVMNYTKYDIQYPEMCIK